MADGFIPIPRCQPGEDSLVSATYANELIDLLNSLGGATVAPTSNIGSFKIAGGFFILDLTPFDTRLRAVESSPSGNGGGLPTGGNVGQALVVNNVANNVATPYWSNVVTENAIRSLQNTLLALISSINNSTGNLVCDMNNNTGTMTMNYPSLPNGLIP